MSRATHSCRLCGRAGPASAWCVECGRAIPDDNSSFVVPATFTAFAPKDVNHYHESVCGRCGPEVARAHEASAMLTFLVR